MGNAGHYQYTITLQGYRMSNLLMVEDLWVNISDTSRTKNLGEKKHFSG